MHLQHDAEAHCDILELMEVDRTFTHGSSALTVGTLEGEPVLKILRGDGQALTIYL